jgi:hypothetical protein
MFITSTSGISFSGAMFGASHERRIRVHCLTFEKLQVPRLRSQSSGGTQDDKFREACQWISLVECRGYFHRRWLQGKWNCRSLGCPRFPVEVGGVGGVHAVFSNRKPHARLYPVQRGRKSGFARDDKYRLVRRPALAIGIGRSVSADATSGDQGTLQRQGIDWFAARRLRLELEGR